MALRLPPGPPAKPLGGNLLDFQRDPIAYFTRVARTYGDIALFVRRPFYGYLLSDPNSIKDVLVTYNKRFTRTTNFHLWLKKGLGDGVLVSNGDFHTRQRRLMQPAFHRVRIAGYAEIMTRHGTRVPEARWHSGDSVNIVPEMSRITLAIVSEALFGANTEANAEQIGWAMDVSNDYISSRPMQLFSDLRHQLPLPSTLRFRKAQQILDSTIYSFIRERRSSGQRTGDLLSLLLDATDAEGDGGGMDDQQLRDEASTLFAAGHETTAMALSWTWYVLSQNPDVEAQFYAELDKVLAGRAPALDDISRLPYTRMVLTEAIRLYPPAWALGRVALDDYEVGGYTVPKGSVIIISPYVVHHDPRLYTDPERFDPQRWTKAAEAKRPRFSFIAFGAGPHQCIGEQFAWMEGVLVLAAIGRHWKLRLAPGQRIALDPMITLRPKHGLSMTLERRVQ
jgi:cytochrome P450